MFTGLVEGQGEIERIVQEGSGLRFDIRPPWTAETGASTKLGESIAINGCCLTVINIKQGLLSFQAGEETLSRTNLGRQKVGSRVNLERSLKMGDSLGGHLVQGHIDCTGQVLQIREDGDWKTIFFSVPAEYARLLVSKGSIAVDGVSLTVVEVSPHAGTEHKFSVALIPHTLQVTTLGTLQTGDIVNLEVDILAKQLARLAEPILLKLAEGQLKP